MANSNILF